MRKKKTRLLTAPPSAAEEREARVGHSDRKRKKAAHAKWLTSGATHCIRYMRGGASPLLQARAKPLQATILALPSLLSTPAAGAVSAAAAAADASICHGYHTAKKTRREPNLEHTSAFRLGPVSGRATYNSGVVLLLLSSQNVTQPQLDVVHWTKTILSLQVVIYIFLFGLTLHCSVLSPIYHHKRFPQTFWIQDRGMQTRVSTSGTLTFQIRDQRKGMFCRPRFYVHTCVLVGTFTDVYYSIQQRTPY